MLCPMPDNNNYQIRSQPQAANWKASSLDSIGKYWRYNRICDNWGCEFRSCRKISVIDQREQQEI
jgi:hypothetical protein